MIYQSGKDYLAADRKQVLLFGMSGLGKTHVSAMLRDTPAGAGGGWFHYSVDYRIGTHYMGERIADMFKREAMKQPLLRELLLSDSVYIASNITFDNLAPLSTYLGKPGDAARGGLPFAEYCKRQAEHREAEIAATLDTARFMSRAEDLYGYPNFICDSSGSICEVVEPDDPADPVLAQLEETLLLVWIRGSDAHRAELIRRFDRAPKPIYYNPAFLAALWQEFLALKGLPEDRVDPDEFLRFGYARLLAHRQPRYEAMARRGITVTADEVAALRSPADFDTLIAMAIDRRA
jgi:PAS domain-containing protein